ncbi:MAG TPA: aldehyde dehydrogenase family protein [Nitrospiria bacterium]|nr:aldehyde dehydrogenase family protein [Nitrospiria bacterium]
MAATATNSTDDRLLIDGEWVAAGHTTPIRNPYNGEIVGHAPQAAASDLERAIAASLRCFAESRRWPRHRRAALLSAVAEGLRRSRDDLARLMTAEAGKPIRYAEAEVDRAVWTFTVASEEAKRLAGELPPLDSTPVGEGYLAMTARLPVGPIAAISPFNFPLNLVAHKVAPALAVGAPVVLKPPPQAPLTSLRLGRIIQEAGAPPGLVNVVPCPVDVAAKLVTDDRLSLLSFTGSARVGWALKNQAGKKRVVLELGGNAAAIVQDDAEYESAAARLAVGAFAYAGQVCISTQRVYVHEAIHDRFLDRFLAAVKQLPVGDPADPATVVGPMIDQAAADRVEGWVKEAVGQGATLLLAGTRRGNVLSPVVLADVSPRMKVVCEEVFGPVVVISRYRAFHEAVDAVNASPYGLQASVFTRRLDDVLRAWGRLDVGGVIVNDYPMFRVDQMPYGGAKESGLGREGVRYAMESMTEPRLMVVRMGESLGL